MILKFDDVIYNKSFTIEAKNETFDLTVELTDVESEELATIMINLIKGIDGTERINEILFKDSLVHLKELLIGFNYVKFQRMVLNDFQNFMQVSIDESTKILKDL